MSNRWKLRTYIAGGTCALVLVVLRVGRKLRWSSDYLTGWGNFITGVGTLILALGAIYAAYVALAEYREKSAIEKAKWLSDLFKQLFVDPTFKKVRQKVDFNE